MAMLPDSCRETGGAILPIEYCYVTLSAGGRAREGEDILTEWKEIVIVRFRCDVNQWKNVAITIDFCLFVCLFVCLFDWLPGGCRA